MMICEKAYSRECISQTCPIAVPHEEHRRCAGEDCYERDDLVRCVEMDEPAYERADG
jgi:hypothetical protein